MYRNRNVLRCIAMYVSRRHTISRKWACSFSLAGGMGWQRWVGSKNLYISFAEYCLFYRALLQKRSIILSILLTEVTPYDLSMAYMPLSWVVNWPLYRDAWLVWGRCKRSHSLLTEYHSLMVCMMRLLAGVSCVLSTCLSMVSCHWRLLWTP